MATLTGVGQQSSRFAGAGRLGAMSRSANMRQGQQNLDFLNSYYGGQQGIPQTPHMSMKMRAAQAQANGDFAGQASINQQYLNSLGQGGGGLANQVFGGGRGTQKNVKSADLSFTPNNARPNFRPKTISAGGKANVAGLV